MDREKFICDLFYGGNIEEIEKLLDEGSFHVDEKVIAGHTSLTFSIQQNQINIVNMLLKRGADPNYKLKISCYKPLEMACSYYVSGQPEMVNLLLAYGAVYDKKRMSIVLEYKDPLEKREINKIFEMNVVCVKPAKG